MVALVVWPNLNGEGECEGGDCSDIVTRDGTDYVLMFACDAVQAGLHRSHEDGVMNPALPGAPEAHVSTFAIAGLPVDEVIAVVGPRAVVCPGGPVPGSGVAFSLNTDAETTAGRIRTILQP